MTWQQTPRARRPRQRGDEDAFAELTDPYRRELQLHCYRILGSLQDAEDLLQETLLAAWRGLEEFEGRSSLRAWLYTIATNRCLNALRIATGATGRARGPARAGTTRPRALPRSLARALSRRAARRHARHRSGARGAATRPRSRSRSPSSPGFSTCHRASGRCSCFATCSATAQRRSRTCSTRAKRRSTAPCSEPGRRSTLAPAGRERAGRAPLGPRTQLLGRFAEAFESGDIEAIVALLTDDAVLTMPPEPRVTRATAIDAFLRARQAGAAAGLALRPVAANRQPAFAFYLDRRRAGCAAGIFVIGVRPDGIESITRFHDRGLLDRFGAPRAPVARASSSERALPMLHSLWSNILKKVRVLICAEPPSRSRDGSRADLTPFFFFFFFFKKINSP